MPTGRAGENKEEDMEKMIRGRKRKMERKEEAEEKEGREIARDNVLNHGRLAQLHFHCPGRPFLLEQQHRRRLRDTE